MFKKFKKKKECENIFKIKSSVDLIFNCKSSVISVMNIKTICVIDIFAPIAKRFLFLRHYG